MRIRSHVRDISTFRRQMQSSGMDILVFDGVISQESIGRTYASLRRGAFYWRAASNCAPSQWRRDLGHVDAVKEVLGDIEELAVNVTGCACRLVDSLAQHHVFGHSHSNRVNGVPRGHIAALYCANSEWDPLWNGELCYNDTPRGTALLVAMRPGRIVLFDSRLSYTHLTLSRECWEPQLLITSHFALLGEDHGQ